PADWTWPLVTDQQELTFGNGEVVPVVPGSEKHSYVGFEQIDTVIEDEATHTLAQSVMPDDSIATYCDQLARDACAILYETPDDFHFRPRHIRLRYVEALLDSDGNPTQSTLNIKKNDLPIITLTRRAFEGKRIASSLTFAMAYLYQNLTGSKVTDQTARNTTIGINVFIRIELGYLTSANRPNGGGARWDENRFTAGFFFHYIVHDAPTPSPNFVKDLNKQFNRRIHGDRVWTKDLITEINARRMTVDELWTEYKAWVANQ
ncbi:hypothetical protein CR983_03415, partial [Candidatus Saccharibacteria bacterium]